MFVFLLIFLVSTAVSAQNECAGTSNKKAKKCYDNGLKDLRNNNTGSAINNFLRALDHEDEYADAHYRLGRIFFQQMRAKDAEKHLKRVIAICPDFNAEVYFFLARIAFGRNDYSETVTYLEEFLKDVERIKRDSDYDNAVQMLDQARFMAKVFGQKVPFSPYKVMDISTPEDEYLGIISHDGELALFTRRIKSQSGKGAVSWSEKYIEIFKMARKNKDRFDSGEPMPPPFNMSGNQGGATITARNDEIYITICNNIKLDNKLIYNNCDIYYSKLVYGDWTPLEKVEGINYDHTWESQPSVSADGKTLYFVSDRPGGFGGSDIYVSYRDENSQWGRPVNLGSRINTPGHEKTPFIHTDSRTLYFSSADRVDESDSLHPGQRGLGGYDIFFSRNQNGVWIKPVNLGYPINSEADDLSFFVSTNGNTGYFSSNNIEGSGGYDLYAFDLYPEARPEKVLFVTGEVRDESDNPVFDSKIELRNVGTDEVIQVDVDPINARYVAIALFNNDFVLTVKKADHIYQSRLIDRDSSMFQAPVEINFEMEKVETGKSYQLHDIYFDINQYQVSEKSRFILNEFVAFLNDNPSIRVAIHGHTDNMGDDAMNLELSKRRAQSVYEYLVSRGIIPSRLSSQGFGKTRPVADNSTEEGRARNRRTEFVISGR